MKKALTSAVLAATIALGAATAPSFADDSENSAKIVRKTVVKSAHLKKGNKERPLAKETTIQPDYYAIEREKLMKISM